MNTVLERHGRFALIQADTGYYWRLTSRQGTVWYWHSDTGLWTPRCQPCQTEEEATRGLAWTLAHEDAGDLDKQPRCPPTGRHCLMGT
jgi:hypothetical protein